MPERSLALPVAIVAGCTIIGIFAYLGLREGLRPAPATPVAAPTTPAAPPQPPQAKHSIQRPPPEPVADRVYRQAQAALDAQRPALVETCWTPPGKGEPASILLTYDVTFGADGGIVAIGISDQRDAYRTSVSDCVRKQPRPSLPIVPPPGESVRVILGLPMP